MQVINFNVDDVLVSLSLFLSLSLSLYLKFLLKKSVRFICDDDEYEKKRVVFYIFVSIFSIFHRNQTNIIVANVVVVVVVVCCCKTAKI